MMTWHHPIGREITCYNPYPLCTGLARWAQEGYGDTKNRIHSFIPNVDVVITYGLIFIHPKRRRNHQLWVDR
jgi:hypothetical protein